MYTLYGTKAPAPRPSRPRSRSSAPPGGSSRTASWAPNPAFDELLPINPTGQIPTLVLPDGSVLTESAAILIHLADAHPDSGLLPAAAPRARRRSAASSSSPPTAMPRSASSTIPSAGARTATRPRASASAPARGRGCTALGDLRRPLPRAAVPRRRAPRRARSPRRRRVEVVGHATRTCSRRARRSTKCCAHRNPPAVAPVFDVTGRPGRLQASSHGCLAHSSAPCRTDARGSTRTPYLTVRDAARAVEFYKQALGATEVMRLEGPEARSPTPRSGSASSRSWSARRCRRWARRARSPRRLAGEPARLREGRRRRVRACARRRRRDDSVPSPTSSTAIAAAPSSTRSATSG